MNTNFFVSLNRETLVASLRFDKSMHSVTLLVGTIPDAVYREYGFDLPWHSFKKSINSIAKLLRKEGVGIEFDEYAKHLIDEWLDDREKLQKKSSLIELSDKEIRTELTNFGFSRKLTDEQYRDLRKLLRLKHGANFSVPGAGKTTTLLATHSILKSKMAVNCLFVVAPINAFISWEDEIKAIFKRKLNVIRMRSDDIINFYLIEEKKPDVLLINYEKMRKNIQGLYSFFSRMKIHLVLDESHRIKSGNNNLSFQQIINLADLAKRRDILSGTPMPQSVMDLDAQFDYLWSENIIEPYAGKDLDIDKERLGKITKHISDLYVRTTKKELGLPTPTIKYRRIEMGSIQSELYELFRSESARLLAGVDRNTKEYMRNIGRSAIGLLQAATNPMLLGTVDEFFQETLPVPENARTWSLLSEYSQYEKSAKIDYLIRRVGKILSQDSANKIVVWTSFVRNVKLLERTFLPYNPVSIYGAVPSGDEKDEDNREGRIRKFHYDSTCRLMIANPQAGGEGISLHKVCHYAIYLDRTFNAAHYLQSVDRIHRLGLPRNTVTTIEIIVAKDTIDEVVANRLGQKTKLMSKVLNDPGLAKLAYDPEDLVGLESEFDKEDQEQIQNHIISHV
jgi:SNF2 family DNA or RNA helicase